MSAKRNLWVYRALVVIVAVLFLFSATRPWWTSKIQGMLGGYGSSRIIIYAYGLTHNATLLKEFLISYETPPLLMRLAQVYLASSAVVCVLSTFIKDRWGWRILAIVGFVYLIYSLAFIPVIYEGTGRAPIPSEHFPIQGEIIVYTDIETLKITSSFQDGYYLAVASASLCVVLALVRRRLLRNEFLRSA